MLLGNSLPDPFFHSQEFGNVHIHSRDSPAPGNDVFCAVLLAQWR